MLRGSFAPWGEQILFTPPMSNWGQLGGPSQVLDAGLLDPCVEVERRMKKYLLGTTALVGASVVATSAMAMPIQSQSEQGVPILTASIVAQWEAGIASNDNPTASANTRDGGFVNGRFAEVFFNGELTADNGLVYGAKIHLGTGGVQTNGFPGREYIYLSGGWGSMEFGNWIGADSGLNLCLTCNTYAGYGGLDTPWKSYIINPAPDVGQSGLRFRNGSVNRFWFDQSVKATYYTPVFAGFQAGVSYTPERNAFGAQPGGTFVDNKGQHNDVFQFGGQWNGDFGGVGVAVSAVGAVSDGFLTAVTGTTGTNVMKDVTGIGYYELGAVVRYAGFQFGGSYWDEGTGGAIKARDFGFESYGWTLDAAYFFGPYGIEVQYMSTTTESSNRIIPAGGILPAAVAGLTPGPASLTESYEVDAWAVSFGYNVAPGLKWYAEVVGADFDHGLNAACATLASGCNIDANNDAVAAITGLVLSF